MQQRIGLVTLVVRSYEEAIAFYVGKLGFVLVQDASLEAGKRWVVVAPAGHAYGAALLLARADNETQLAAIGKQAGGRVFLFLETDDFARDYDAWRKRGVTFCEEPRDEEYGRVAVFEDLYGNRWDLIEPRPKP